MIAVSPISSTPTKAASPPTWFTEVLEREGVDISMDGRCRELDNIFAERLWRNVKYEDVYLNGYAAMDELHVGLTQYFTFYNGERSHQGLNYRTPDVVYETGECGGAMIVDKYGSAPDPGPPEPVPGFDVPSAEEHEDRPQTPPCRELNAVTATPSEG